MDMKNRTVFPLIFYWLAPMACGFALLPLVRNSENARFVTAVLFIVLIFVANGINYSIRAFAMWRYVENSNIVLWRELNTVPLLGYGYRNLSKFATFMFVGRGNEDLVLKKLKENTRKAFWYTVFVFISSPFFFLIYMTF
jgi:hypothetical protein